MDVIHVPPPANGDPPSSAGSSSSARSTWRAGRRKGPRARDVPSKQHPQQTPRGRRKEHPVTAAADHHSRQGQGRGRVAAAADHHSRQGQGRGRGRLPEAQDPARLHRGGAPADPEKSGRARPAAAARDISRRRRHRGCRRLPRAGAIPTSPSKAGEQQELQQVCRSNVGRAYLPPLIAAGTSNGRQGPSVVPTGRRSRGGRRSAASARISRPSASWPRSWRPSGSSSAATARRARAKPRGARRRLHRCAAHGRLPNHQPFRVRRRVVGPGRGSGCGRCSGREKTRDGGALRNEKEGQRAVAGAAGTGGAEAAADAVRDGRGAKDTPEAGAGDAADEARAGGTCPVDEGGRLARVEAGEGAGGAGAERGAREQLEKRARPSARLEERRREQELGRLKREMEDRELARAKQELEIARMERDLELGRHSRDDGWPARRRSPTANTERSRVKMGRERDGREGARERTPLFRIS